MCIMEIFLVCIVHVSIPYFFSSKSRQEQERQELSRRHQQELQSYKLHHIRTHYGRNCCFHSKSTQSAVASSQTGGGAISSYGNSFHHSNDQVAPECTVNLTNNQNLHTNSEIVCCEGEQNACTWSSNMQQQYKNTSIVNEAIQNTIVNKQVEVSMQNNVGQHGTHNHFHCNPDSSNQLLNGMVVCSLPAGQTGADISVPSNSDPQLSNYASPMLVHDIQSNENMAALNKKLISQRSLEVAPHSSPQTVRRIINATSAININPAFHNISPIIPTSVSVPQLISENVTYNGHSHVQSVSLPCSHSSDVIVSTPSKSCFCQPDS